MIHRAFERSHAIAMTTHRTQQAAQFRTDCRPRRFLQAQEMRRLMHPGKSQSDRRPQMRRGFQALINRPFQLLQFAR
jgi:hypothetical protein